MNKLSLTLRQEFSSIVLSYAVSPGNRQWFEGQGKSFDGDDERRYTDWLEKRVRKVEEERDAAIELALLNGRALESLFPKRGS